MRLSRILVRHQRRISSSRSSSSAAAAAAAAGDRFFQQGPTSSGTTAAHFKCTSMIPMARRVLRTRRGRRYFSSSSSWSSSSPSPLLSSLTSHQQHFLDDDGNHNNKEAVVDMDNELNLTQRQQQQQQQQQDPDPVPHSQFEEKDVPRSDQSPRRKHDDHQPCRIHHENHPQHNVSGVHHDHHTLLQLAESMTEQITTNVDRILTLLDRRQDSDMGITKQGQSQSRSGSCYYTNKWKKQFQYEQTRRQRQRQRQRLQRMKDRQYSRYHHRERHGDDYDDDDGIQTMWQTALIHAGLDGLAGGAAAAASVVVDSSTDDSETNTVDAGSGDADALVGGVIAEARPSNDDDMVLATQHRADDFDDHKTRIFEEHHSSASSSSSEIEIECDPNGVDNKNDDNQIQTNSSSSSPSIHQSDRTPIFNFQLDGYGHIDEQHDHYNSFLISEQEREEDLEDELQRQDLITTQDTTEFSVNSSKSEKNGDDIIAGSHRMNEKAYNDAIIRVISLLSVIDGDTWWKFEHSQNYSHGRTETGGGGEEEDDDAESIQDDDTNLDDNIHGGTDAQSNLLQLRESLQELITDQDRRLPTWVANLALGYLSTMYRADVLPSDKDLSDEMLENCAQIYARLVDQGTNHFRDDENDDAVFDSTYIPDETTYRLLLKAYNGRLMAYTDAIKLSKGLIIDENETTSVDSVTSEVLYEGLKACKIKMDIVSARSMMDSVLSSNENANASIRPSLGSVMMMLDMLKIQGCRSEALEFIDKLQNKRILSPNAQDKVLLSLCGWPTHSRGGERLDLSSFYQDIMSRMEHSAQDKNNRCGLHIWAKLVERMELSAKFDPSLWRSIFRAMKTVLVAYPDNYLNWKMTTIGLEAARLAAEADMAAEILRRQDQQISIPQRAFKACLDICLETNNTTACDSIVETLQELESDYPAGVRQDLHGLILMCYAKAGDGKKAMDCLRSMMNSGMDPDDRLYGAVLHAFGSTGQHENVRSIFQEIPAAGVASYDALLVSCIRSMSWDEADELYDEMVQMNISPSPQTVQAILLVKLNKYGKDEVASTLESLLANEMAVFDETSFRLCSKILFREIPGFLDDFRQDLRNDSIPNGQDEDRLHANIETLQQTKLDLIRSIRTAEVESSRRTRRHSHKHTKDHQRQQGQDEWRTATENLLKFTKELSKSCL